VSWRRVCGSPFAGQPRWSKESALSQTEIDPSPTQIASSSRRIQAGRYGVGERPRPDLRR
jgi:hypothetical protein